MAKDIKLNIIDPKICRSRNDSLQWILFIILIVIKYNIYEQIVTENNKKIYIKAPILKF